MNQTTVCMSYSDYLEECFKVQSQFTSWRTGQVLFNVLSEQRPALADRVRTTELDPFYADHSPRRRQKIDAFLTFVRQNW